MPSCGTQVPSPSASADSTGVASSSTAPRTITLIACAFCHENKKKCDGKNPCSRCVEREIECVRNRKRRFSYRKRKAPEGVSEMAVVARRSPANEVVAPLVADHLVSHELLVRLLDVANSFLGRMLTFGDDYTCVDLDTLYSTPARSVRTDAVLSICCRGIGLSELSSKLDERSLQRCSNLMCDFSMDTVSAFFTLAFNQFGTDVRKVRYFLKLAMVTFKETAAFAERNIPSAVPQQTMLEIDSPMVLLVQVMFMFLRTELNPVFHGAFAALGEAIPFVAIRVREALRELDDMELSPGLFDIAGSVCDLTEEQIQQLVDNIRNHIYDDRARGALTRVREFMRANEAMMEDRRCTMLYLACMNQMMTNHFLLSEYAATRCLALRLLEKMEQFPASFLPGSVLSVVGQLFEVGMQLGDGDIFYKTMGVARALSYLSSINNLLKAMEGVPKKISLKEFYGGRADPSDDSVFNVTEDTDDQEELMDIFSPPMGSEELLAFLQSGM